MSSLHDPFDLLDTEKMDNIVPFLPTNRINSMIDQAVTYPQLHQFARKGVSQHTPAVKRPWQIAGVGMAACLALFLTLFSGTDIPSFDGTIGPHQEIQHVIHPVSDDMTDLNDMMIMDTLDSD